jgi:hypothetical protein
VSDLTLKATCCGIQSIVMTLIDPLSGSNAALDGWISRAICCGNQCDATIRTLHLRALCRTLAGLAPYEIYYDCQCDDTSCLYDPVSEISSDQKIGFLVACFVSQASHLLIDCAPIPPCHDSRHGVGLAFLSDSPKDECHRKT